MNIFKTLLIRDGENALNMTFEDTYSLLDAINITELDRISGDLIVVTTPDGKRMEYVTTSKRTVKAI